MVGRKFSETIYIIAAIVAIILGIFYVMDLQSKNVELANRINNLETERENLMQIREIYLNFITELAKDGKVSIREISSSLPEKDAENVSDQLSSSTLKIPLKVDLYFYPSGWMGDSEYGEKYITSTKSEGYIKIAYAIGPKGWAGIYWQYPDSNWGNQPGRNLIEAKRITFQAKGETGNEIVEFKTGGIRGQKYEDSFEKSIGLIKLSTDWKQYEIDLTDQELSSVIGAFAWVASKDANPKGLTFYLKEIYFKK